MRQGRSQARAENEWREVEEMKVRKKTFNNQNQAAIYAEELRNKGAYDVVCLPKDGTQKYIVYAYYL